MSEIGYQWFKARLWWRGMPDRLAWWCAWRLPRKIALYAFVRVYGVLGDCGPDYSRAYRAWEHGQGR